MAGKRTYGDACGVARALDAVGDRWALMVVRELLLGPKRFGGIREGLPGLSADVLTQRLRGLEEVGVVRQRILPPPASAKVYELTPAGYALEPAVVALGRWGGANAAPPVEGVGMSFDSHILSLRTLFCPALAAGFEARIQLRLDGGDFRAAIAGGEAEIVAGEDPHADASIHASAEHLFEVVRGLRSAADAERARVMRIEGDRELAERFFGLFPIPEPAETG